MILPETAWSASISGITGHKHVEEICACLGVPVQNFDGSGFWIGFSPTEISKADSGLKMAFMSGLIPQYYTMAVYSKHARADRSCCGVLDRVYPGCVERRESYRCDGDGSLFRCPSWEPDAKEHLDHETEALAVM
jgi:hypothetical protein